MAKADQPDVKPDEPREKTISQMFAEVTPIEEAVKAGAREALLRHKLLRQPAVTMHDGKIVWISPDELDALE